MSPDFLENIKNIRVRNPDNSLGLKNIRVEKCPDKKADGKNIRVSNPVKLENFDYGRVKNGPVNLMYIEIVRG